MPQHIGIHYPEWRNVPKEKKDDLWSIIKEKFSFESNHSEEDIKDWIISDMSSKRKCWKYELKKSSYDPTMTIDEIVASQTDDRMESERKKVNRKKSIEPHVTGTKSFSRLKVEETKKNKGVSPSRGGMYCITRTKKDGSIVNAIAAKVVADIKANSASSSTSQETPNNSDWTNDDLSKVKGPERRGSVRCIGKFLVRNEKRSQDPQVPLLKDEVKYLRQGFMMLAAAVQEQVPNLNLSSVMNFMNMEADGLSSIHDNTSDKNPSSEASGMSHHQNSHVSVHDTHTNKSDAKSSVLPVKESTTQKSALKKSGGSRHHTSVLPVKESTTQKSALKKSGGSRHHTSGNISAVHDTLNKPGTSRFNTSASIGKQKVIQKCLEAL